MSSQPYKNSDVQMLEITHPKRSTIVSSQTSGIGTAVYRTLGFSDGWIGYPLR